MDDTMFHKNNYNTRKAMQEYASAILRELPGVDRARNFEELREAIYKMLQLLGKCGGADRVCLFDKSRNGQEAYSERYEWCAPGVPSKAEECRWIAASELPVWDTLLKKGEAFAIGDVEEVRQKMPKEYEMMKRQQISSMIVVPIYNRNRLSGFIGMDNPYSNLSQLFVQQISFVGAHLNTARENLRLIIFQEKTLQKMEREQQILNILCEDSTSVFKVNLLNNQAEIIKLDDKTNISTIMILDEGMPVDYREQIKAFYDQFVIPESAPDFLETFEADHLMRLLKDRRVISRKFQTEPNGMKQQYFEVRVTKIEESEAAFYVLMDFRHIDEIVAEEKKRQMELERALDEAEMKNDIISAISKIYFAIYRIDLNSRCYEEISGIEKHERIGESGRLIDKLDGVRIQNIAARYQKYAARFFDITTLNHRLRNDESTAAEYMVRDGNWHLARFIVQERDENGDIQQVLLAIRSISEEKRREKNLIEAVDDANQANEAKSDFLSRMSHDIRTPMNAIMGFTNIAQQHMDNPQKLEDCLRKIEQSGENLQQLVNDILDISRIESGEFKVNLQPVDICRVFDIALESISGIAAEKGLLLSGKKHDISQKILIADPLRLNQIYTNLLSNAVKYTMNGGYISFEIYEEKAKDAGKIRLVSIIKDTGIGMSEEFMKQMYTKFARAVDTRVNEVRGSGLGLSIVKQIVEMMDGTIEVKSEPGKGTAFKIQLDLQIAEGQEKEEEEGQQEIKLPDRTVRVLAAEDNDLNYEILEEQLKPYGVECVHAENGMDAVQKFQYSVPGEYDVILMDMQMPVMNGPEAAAEIRRLSHPDAGTIPIIALTANAYQRDVQKCMESGMNAHLSKPVKMEQLLRIIADYLSDNGR